MIAPLRPCHVLAVLSIFLTAQLAVVGQPAAAVTGTPIPLPAPQGQRLLLQSTDRADYGPLSQEFVTQANLGYCGVASAVMVLNSLGIPAPAAKGYEPYRFWTQANVFEAAATLRVVRPEIVAKEGMTLQQLQGLLASRGLKAHRIHGDQISLGAFRNLLRRNMENQADHLLVNYQRMALGQKGGGHISPIGAYHTGSDRVLILDVARYRYPAVWVKAADLWRALRTVDTVSGRSRGLVVIHPPS